MISRQLEEDHEFYRTLILANGADLFLEKLAAIFSKHMREDTDIPEKIRMSKMFALRISFFGGGIVNMYKQWFKGELKCSLNDIAMEVSNVIALSSKNLIA